MRPPGPFETGARAYDGWYARHPGVYAAELKALRLALPAFARGLEVGVGTARFASALGLGWGIDPARSMLEVGRERGVRAVQAAGEELPFGEGSFDCVLMVTTLPFVRDPSRVLAEAGRVLRAGGALALGFIDPESRLGRDYRRRAEGGGFYAGARFLAVPAVLDLLSGGPWSRIGVRQTLFPGGGEDREQPVREGHGVGAFVVVSARKASRPPRRRGGQTRNETRRTSMKVVFTANGTGLSAPADPRFGRCANFILMDTESMAVQSHPNPSRQAAGGAGIQAGQFAASLGAQAVVTGQVGPNAARVLKAAGIRIFVGASGTVQEALEAFRAGNLSEADAATVEAHSGMGGKR